MKLAIQICQILLVILIDEFYPGICLYILPRARLSTYVVSATPLNPLNGFDKISWVYNYHTMPEKRRYYNLNFIERSGII